MVYILEMVHNREQFAWKSFSGQYQQQAIQSLKKIAGKNAKFAQNLHKIVLKIR